MSTYIDARRRWPSVVCAQSTGDYIVTELSARLVHAEELELVTGARAHTVAGAGWCGST